MKLRPATTDDAALLFEWANDPETRAGSHTTDPIPWETHVAWLDRVIADPDRQLYIGVEDGRPVGQVRLDRDGGKHVISTTVAPDARGRGLSEPMMAAAIETAEGLVVAEIKPDNVRSVRMCAAVGFVEVDRTDSRVLMVSPGRRDARP